MLQESYQFDQNARKKGRGNQVKPRGFGKQFSTYRRKSQVNAGNAWMIPHNPYNLVGSRLYMHLLFVVNNRI